VDVRRLRDVVWKGVFVGCGFVAPLLALEALSRIRADMSFVRGMASLMGLATQGDFAEGWRAFWAYLWYAEHGLLLVWVAGALAVVTFAIQRPGPARSRGVLWLAAAAAIYSLLTVNSTVLHKSVVLGRFARQAVPFFCLATAAALRELLSTGGAAARQGLPWYRRRAIITVAVLALLAQVAFNFARPLRQRFPIELDREIMAAYRNSGIARDMTIAGPEWFNMEAPTLPSPYVLFNTATFIYPVRGLKPPCADGTDVLSFAHPLSFAPYQYEVFGPVERGILRAGDIRIRLVDTRTVR
jgi:hypothetical protein